MEVYVIPYGLTHQGIAVGVKENALDIKVTRSRGNVLIMLLHTVIGAPDLRAVGRGKE